MEINQSTDLVFERQITHDLERLIFEYYDSPPEGVSLPTASLAGARRKCLGRYPEEGSLIAVFDEMHWQSKRDHQPQAPEPVDTDKPFDASCFNFNKASDRETISHVELCGSLHQVMVNISPLMSGHIVVPLWAEKQLPQGALGSDGVRGMLQLAQNVGRDDFRVAYNSLGAFASVNHLHVHGLFADGLDVHHLYGNTKRFPIEVVTRRQHATTATGIVVSTLISNTSNGHHVNALVFEIGDVKGCCVDDLARAVGSCVELLASMGLPHNLLVRMKPTPACFLIPRQPQERFPTAEVGCNAAVCEMCGFLVMQSLESYEKLSLESARAAFLAGASLPSFQYDLLLARCTGQLHWRRASFLRSQSADRVVVAVLGLAALALAVTYARRGR